MEHSFEKNGCPTLINSISKTRARTFAFSSVHIYPSCMGRVESPQGLTSLEQLLSVQVLWRPLCGLAATCCYHPGGIQCGKELNQFAARTFSSSLSFFYSIGRVESPPPLLNSCCLSTFEHKNCCFKQNKFKSYLFLNVILSKPV